MPVGENITKFNGTVLLNTVSAFVWEKLQEPLSKEELLQAILDKFELNKIAARWPARAVAQFCFTDK